MCYTDPTQNRVVQTTLCGLRKKRAKGGSINGSEELPKWKNKQAPALSVDNLRKTIDHINATDTSKLTPQSLVMCIKPYVTLKATLYFHYY